VRQRQQDRNVDAGIACVPRPALSVLREFEDMLGDFPFRKKLFFLDLFNHLEEFICDILNER
jgi:hypothetical protein